MPAGSSLSSKTAHGSSRSPRLRTQSTCASAIAQTLGATPLDGETPERTVERFLAPKDALVVLDNFEHVLPAAPLITELLAAAPALTVMATSREPLRLQAEYRYAVAPLEVPADAEPAAVTHAAAGALFVERAGSHDRDFELTAGDAGERSPRSAESRRTLAGHRPCRGTHYRALPRGSGHTPRRERSTCSATGHSMHPIGSALCGPPSSGAIDLLSAAEAEAFARFAVFAGGATTEAVQTVTGADIDALHGLIEKQLLVRRHESGGEARLWMLETVREYALEQLDADAQRTHARDRHCRYYLALTERAEPNLFTSGEAEWLRKLDAEADNFRAALDWCIRDGDPTHGLRLAGLLGRYWAIRNMAPEGLDWLESAIAAAGDRAPSRDRARARRAQVHLLVDQGAAYDTRGPLDKARSKAADALAISREAAEPAGVADALLAMADLEMAASLPQRRRRALADEALSYARKANELQARGHRADGPSEHGSTGQWYGGTRAGRDRAAQARLLTHPRRPLQRCAYSAIKLGTRSAPDRSWLRRSRWRVSSEPRGQTVLSHGDDHKSQRRRDWRHPLVEDAAPAEA